MNEVCTRIAGGLLLSLLASTSPAAQLATTDIRVTGEAAIVQGDATETVRQAAMADAERKTMRQAVARLQDLAQINDFKLKPVELEAYTAAIVSIDEPPAQTSGAARGDLYRIDVVLQWNPQEAVRRFGGLRKDQEASIDLVESWKQMEILYRRLAEQTERRPGSPSSAAPASSDVMATLTALRLKHLAAQATAALARTEERPVGGRSSSAQGRQRARQLAEAALALSPESGDAHACMGDVLMEARQPEAAETEYRRALTTNADSSLARVKLANALSTQDKLPDAAGELREALRLDPGSVRAHADLGWVFEAQGNSAGAVAEYREALRLDPDFVEAHNGLAVTLAQQGQLPEAIAQFREIVRIDPDSAIGYYNLSYALADMDQDAESAAALREVVRISPNHYNARYNLGELFRLEGKFDESAKQFREYLRLSPPDTPQNRRNIERARNFIKQFENP
jgi:tetratricopeptide (TPR) repeat protein